MPERIEDRHAADVFGLTYREFAAVRNSHYRWRVLAPEAVEHLRRAHAEFWSAEKLADYLQSDAGEAAQKLRRYIMSRRVNEKEKTSERITTLFQEWLDRFEPDAPRRRALAADLSRLLSSQLHLASEAGEKLEDIALGLEHSGEEKSMDLNKAKNGTGWGPAWKD